MATVTVISPVTGKPVEHKRVAAYCRVSTNSADQQNSYNTQVRYYTARDLPLSEKTSSRKPSSVQSDNSMSRMPILTPHS